MRPRRGFFAVRVFLQAGLALQVFVDGVEHFDFFGAESKSGRQGAAIAGLDQLNDNDCRLGGNGDEFHQSLGGFKPAVLDPQALAFHRAEELLDDPRRLYQVTICQASAALATWWVVSRSQWIGVAPLGGCSSMTSTKLSATLSGKSFSLVFFGRRSEE